MSLVGRKPIKIPEGVSVEISPRKAVVKGAKGELFVPLRSEVAVAVEGNILKVTVKDGKSPQAKAFHGLTRSLLANAVVGVSAGYQKELELVGMGYRVQKKGDCLEFALGFSHPVVFTAPAGITLEAPEQTKVIVKGIDKYLVGQVAANIRALKKPEPYKGKGIRYQGEYVRKKAGKAGKVGATQ